MCVTMLIMSWMFHLYQTLPTWAKRIVVALVIVVAICALLVSNWIVNNPEDAMPLILAVSVFIIIAGLVIFIAHQMVKDVSEFIRDVCNPF